MASSSPPPPPFDDPPYISKIVTNIVSVYVVK